MQFNKENQMTIISELVNEAKTTFQYRQKYSTLQKKLDRKAPKAGDMAPDFTLFNVTGTESVTLSDFRRKKPVVLVFGSFT
jgi:peroxiredoxin